MGAVVECFEGRDKGVPAGYPGFNFVLGEEGSAEEREGVANGERAARRVLRFGVRVLCTSSLCACRTPRSAWCILPSQLSSGAGGRDRGLVETDLRSAGSSSSSSGASVSSGSDLRNGPSRDAVRVRGRLGLALPSISGSRATWRWSKSKGRDALLSRSYRTGMKVVGLLSGGKDSVYNLLHAIANGHEPIALASLGPGDGKGPPFPCASPPLPSELTQGVSKQMSSIRICTRPWAIRVSRPSRRRSTCRSLRTPSRGQR